jgi:H+/Cl- antiporter ClcA
MFSLWKEFRKDVQPYLEKAYQLFLEQARHERSFTLVFIVAAFLMSSIIVFYGVLFRACEELYRSFLMVHPLAVFFITPVLLLVSWHLVRYFAPFAGGGGIPQVMVAIDMHQDEKMRPYVAEMMSIRTAVVKIISSCIAVMGGGALGNEGPSVHISACVFYSIYRVYNKVQTKLDHKIWVVTGSAAGLAATFNTPLGGIVYAIEELGSQHFSKVKTALLIAILIAGVTSQAMLGTYLYFGTPTTYAVTLKSSVLVVIFSCFIGWGGALFGEALAWAQRKRKQIKGYWKNIFFLLALSYLMAIFIYLDPHALGSGKEYINHLLFKKEEFTPVTPFLRIAGNFVIGVMGVAGGIFAPAFAMGAGLGRLLIEVFSNFVIYDEHRNLFALCGMISFLTGMTRAPFTSFILVLEMTDRHNAVLAMMLSAIVSSFVSQQVSPDGIYEKTKEDIIHGLQKSIAPSQPATSEN